MRDEMGAVFALRLPLHSRYWEVLTGRLKFAPTIKFSETIT